MMSLANRWCAHQHMEYIPEGYDFLAQAQNQFYGIVDSGCTHSCAGEAWNEA